VVETNLRLMAGWTGVALSYLGGILAVLVGAWSFGRLARRERVRVAEAQGLIVMAGAVGLFGAGLAAISLDYAPLVPLGLGIMGPKPGDRDVRRQAFSDAVLTPPGER
jgi:hypothetical protein